MDKLSYFVRGVVLLLVACPALLPVRRGGLPGAVLCAAASKVGEGDGGFGTRPPPPSLISPSSGSIESGGESEEEDDDEHTAWLSSDLSSTPSMSLSQFPAPLRGSDAVDYAEQDDEQQEEMADANEEEEHEPEEDVQEEEEDDDSLEALLSAPVLEDKRAQSSWVHRFCRTPGHEFFCAVPASFLAEEFNWLGLPSDLAAIDLLLGNVVYKGKKKTKDQNYRPPLPPLPWDEAAARRMYGLIHARFIVTQKGLNAMREKYEQGHFGRCPRLACDGQALLPVGVRDGEEKEEEEEEEKEGHTGGVNVFCPCCRELYRPADPYHQQLNGFYWGTSFAHLFILAFPDLCPAPAQKEESMGTGASASSSSSSSSSRGEKDVYVPRVFGFRVEEEEEGGKERPQRGQQQAGRADPTAVPLHSPIKLLMSHDRPPLQISRNKRVVVKTKISFWEISRLWPWRRRRKGRRRRR